jgi:hypothetical protein
VPSGRFCFRFAAKPPFALPDTDNYLTVKLVPGHVVNMTATIIDIALDLAIFRLGAVRLFIVRLQTSIRLGNPLTPIPRQFKLSLPQT